MQNRQEKVAARMKGLTPPPLNVNVSINPEGVYANEPFNHPPLRPKNLLLARAPEWQGDLLRRAEGGDTKKVEDFQLAASKVDIITF